jgi:hypothetical protein
VARDELGNGGEEGVRGDWLRGVRLVLALGFGAGALFHLVSLGWPGIGSFSPPWRHGLFVVVNLFFAGATLRPPRWLVVPAAVLVGQQGYGHGADLLRAAAAGQLDVQSALTLLSLPFVAWVALRALRSRYR